MTIKQKFKNALRRGTGEAHLILQSNPTLDLFEDIRHASITNLAFDPQCEGSRGPYLNELINLSVEKSKITKAILEKLAVETEDYWGISQMFDLARIFAQMGNKEAREVLYKRFELNAEADVEYCGGQSIIKLDGIEGLKRVAEVRGIMLLKDPNDWEDSFVLNGFKAEYPTGKAYTELKEASKHNKFIRVYLQAIRKNKKLWGKRSRRQKYSYNLLKKKVEDNQIRYVSDFVVKDLAKNEVKQLADDFLNEQDIKRREQYLRVFAKIKFPYNYHPLLAIAQGEANKKDRLREFAIDALQFFAAPEIREFAINKLEKSLEPDVYATLLTTNYQKGDSKLLQSIAHQTRNIKVIHSLANSYINIYRANKTKECKNPLETIYQKLNCGLCRYDVIKLLLDNKVLSDKIKSEIPYDSNPKTRLLV